MSIATITSVWQNIFSKECMLHSQIPLFMSVNSVLAHHILRFTKINQVCIQFILFALKVSVDFCLLPYANFWEIIQQCSNLKKLQFWKCPVSVFYFYWLGIQNLYPHANANKCCAQASVIPAHAHTLCAGNVNILTGNNVWN